MDKLEEGKIYNIILGNTNYIVKILKAATDKSKSNHIDYYITPKSKGFSTRGSFTIRDAPKCEEASYEECLQLEQSHEANRYIPLDEVKIPILPPELLELQKLIDQSKEISGV